MKFISLSRFAPDLVSNEERKCKKFKADLRPSIRNKVAAVRHRSFMELPESAQAVERAVVAIQKIRESSRRQGAGTSSVGRHFKRTREPKVSTHQATQRQAMSASSIASSGSNVRKEIVCYQCNQLGHLANNCPNRQMGGRVIRPQQRPQSQESSTVAPQACYTCGQFGHFQRFCPQRVRMPALVAWVGQQPPPLLRCSGLEHHRPCGRPHY